MAGPCALARATEGTKKYIPKRVRPPKKICFLLNFVLKKKGSKKAVITGKVNKESIPTATFDHCNA